jgi:hypothetical protein
MISSTTPDKLAEIIRDTWPNLYRPPSDFKAPSFGQMKTNTNFLTINNYEFFKKLI